MCKYGHETPQECIAEARANSFFKASSFSSDYDSPCEIPRDILLGNYHAAKKVLANLADFPKANIPVLEANLFFLQTMV